MDYEGMMPWKILKNPHEGEIPSAWRKEKKPRGGAQWMAGF